MNAIARPRVALSRVDEAGADWIQLDVPQACEPILRIVDQNRPKPATPQRSRALMSTIVVTHVPTAALLNETRGGIHLAGRADDVIVVGHQRVPVDVESVGSRGDLGEHEKPLEVSAIRENGASIVSAL